MKFLKVISPVVILSAILASPLAAAAEQIELKFGHVGKPGSLFEASVNEFAKRQYVYRYGEKAGTPLNRYNSF